METGEYSIATPDNMSSVMMAAHELKSPVALIRQLALQLESTPAESSQYEQLVRQIVLISERSLRLTTSLTQSMNLNYGIFESEPVNAQQLCEEVAHELTPLYKAHEKKIEVKTRRHSPLVVANRELLRRILLGFGDNALNHASKMETARFEVARAHESIHIGLRDQGPVVSKKLLSSLPKNITGRPNSSGLGLMIAQSFARSMNGEIGSLRHANGMTFYIQMLPSEQMSLL